MTSPKQLGLIGFGQFGRFAAAHLRSTFEVAVADRRPIADTARELGLEAVTVEEAARRPYVLLAVPVQGLRGVLERIAPALRPGTLVMDVCSVKVGPVRWMRQILPDEVEILGTHPMFGPQSAADGLAGHSVVLCPERTERVAPACALLESLGLEVIVSDADTHDRQAACTQALAQYVGRAISALEGGDHPIGTRASALLYEAAGLVADDSEELFVAIQRLNPHAAEVRRRLRERLDALDRTIERAAPGED